MKLSVPMSLGIVISLLLGLVHGISLARPPRVRPVIPPPIPFVENTEKIKTVRISVIIPCYWKHAQNLFALLRLYEEQTVRPDEVVISLSEAHKVEPSVLDALRTEQWRMPVILLETNEVLFAGQNRNRACSHASGDVFILQDADDIPHPKRIEIIQYFFERHDIDHLMHQFFVVHKPDASINFVPIDSARSVEAEWATHFDTVWSSARFTNGNVAISRAVFNAIQWPHGPRKQDTEFNRKVYATFTKRLLLKAPLLCYRIFLSSASVKKIL